MVRGSSRGTVRTATNDRAVMERTAAAVTGVKGHPDFPSGVYWMTPDSGHPIPMPGLRVSAVGSAIDIDEAPVRCYA